MRSEPIDVIAVDFIVAVTATILWLALMIFQLADFGSSVLDERNALRTDARTRMSNQRFAPYFWALPLLAFVGLGIVLGVAYATRLIFDSGEVARGIVILLGLTGLVLFIGIGVLAVVTRRETVTYASLRATLQAVTATRLPKQEIEVLRRQLSSIDDRERDFHLGRRGSSSYRALTVELDGLVRRFVRQPPRGLEVFDSLPWASATRFLFTASAWRLIPVAVAAVPLVAILVAGRVDAEFAGIPL